MRFLKFNIIIALCLGAFASCGYDLEEYNINPQVSTDADPNYQLNFVQMHMMGNQDVQWHLNLGMCSGVVQQISGPYEIGVACGAYGGHDYSYVSWWNTMWSSNLRNIVDLVERTNDKEEYVNLNAAARILKVFNFARVTDMYGDIPYFSAGMGYYSGNFNNKYDSQEAIYDDFFIQLDEAVKALDETQGGIEIDAMFDGDVAKWKRFGNSLRLRLAMRLVKVNSAKATAEVNAAMKASGGLLHSKGDDVLLAHMDITGDDERCNPNSIILGRGNFNHFQICETFSDYLVATNDPRKDVIMAAYANNDKDGENITEKTGYAGLGATEYYWDAAAVVGADGVSRSYGEGAYLSPHKNLVDKDDPSLLMTSAEVQFLLAEAAQRGWISGSAKTYYDAGVEAAMSQLDVYALDNSISGQQVADYLAGNPYIAGDGLEQINYQLWINYFLNGWESYSNWRRSGYPELRAQHRVSWDVYLIDDEPRRLMYVDEEYDRNAENIAEAVAKLEAGGATPAARHIDGRVWWDKK